MLRNPQEEFSETGKELNFDAEDDSPPDYHTNSEPLDEEMYADNLDMGNEPGLTEDMDAMSVLAHLVTDPGRDVDFQTGKAQGNQHMDLQSEGLETNPTPINNGASADGDRERLIRVRSDHDNFIFY